MPRDLVLVGGGHSHVQVLESLAVEPIPGVRATVVVDSPTAIYSGMVPGFVAGQYPVGDLEIDIPRLARLAGAKIVVSAAKRIDPHGRKILVGEGPAIAYDLASLNVGSTVAGLDLPGIRQFALPTRPIGELVHRIQRLILAPRAGTDRDSFRVVVVGGGAGGIELAFTLQARLSREIGRPLSIRLVHSGKRVMTGYPMGLARRIHRKAVERGVEISAERKVVRADEEAIRFEVGEPLAFDLLVWAAGAAAPALLRDSSLPVDPKGFVRTRSTLQVEGRDDLFAVGDCATLDEFPDTPKAGVYAVRQGPVLMRNLRARAAGRSLERYRPQSDFLTLLNLGDGTALGTKWGRSFEGRWVMSLKDRIDRAFMRRFQLRAESASVQ
jgi:selenide,water dikinase